MLTGMGHPLLSNSHSIIPNPKSLFNMNQVRKILLRISLLRIIPIQPPKRSPTPNTNKVMKRKPKTISKEKAIVIASNHNHIPNPNRKGIYRIRTKGSIKASEPKARLLIQPPQTRINTNIQTILNIHIPI